MKQDYKNDSDKLPLNLVDYSIATEIAEVLKHGADVYGANTWQTINDPTERYFAALMRHLIAWRNGEKNDSESGLRHIQHILTNAMFLDWFERNENGRP